MTMRSIGLAFACWLTAVSAMGQTPQQWRDSLAVLNKGIEHYPKSTDLRLRKAAVNIQLDQWEYAVEEYGNVLRIDPENLAALYYRAYCNSHLRQYAMAKSDYESFLKLAPMNMEARLGLALVDEKMGRKTDALDQYNQLVQMFPDSAVCYAARASYETTLEQYDAALYVATKADLLTRLGRKDEARRLLLQLRTKKKL